MVYNLRFSRVIYQEQNFRMQKFTTQHYLYVVENYLHSRSTPKILINGFSVKYNTMQKFPHIFK